MHQDIAVKNAALAVEVGEVRRDLEAAVGDVKWLVKEGIRVVVDKVMLNDEFGVSLIKLKDACVAAGVGMGKKVLRSELGLADEGDSEVIDHETVMEDAMNKVVDADYVSHFGLVDMGVDGLKELAMALVTKG